MNKQETIKKASDMLLKKLDGQYNSKDIDVLKLIWREAQKDIYNKIAQLLMDKGIIYKNGYGCLNSNLKAENMGERLVLFANEMSKLKTNK